MRRQLTECAAAAAIAVSALVTAFSPAQGADSQDNSGHVKDINVQVGPRPYYLLDTLRPGPLKAALEQCTEDRFKQTDFSIGDRGGGTLQFPEHTKVLAREVGIRGIFSDWAATVSYYANCMGLQ